MTQSEASRAGDRRNLYHGAVGVYEIVSGGAGLIAVVVQGSGSFAAVLPLTLPFFALIIAGVFVLAGTRGSTVLSTVLQAAQIPIVAMLGVAWRFVAGIGVGFVITPTSTRVFFAAETTFAPSWGASQLPGALGLNLFPLLVIWMLLRNRRTTNQHEESVMPGARRHRV